MNSRKIKAILFDLDGTLRHHLPTGDEVFLDYLKSQNMDFLHEDKIRAAKWEHYYFANSPEIKEDTVAFKDDRNAFWVNFSKRRLSALGLTLSQCAELAPNVSAHMGKHYKPEVIVPEDAPLILTKLKETGYTLGIVTNREEPVHEELKTLNLDPFFDFSLAGGEVGSFKPESRIFEHALERAGTSAEETMYIGDNYFADVVGSLRAGLLPVLYDPIRLFPEAECAVIQTFSQLPELLD